MYIYLNVRSDAKHSQFRKTAELRPVLNEDPRLTASNPAQFANTAGTPWLVLSLLHATPEGNFSCSGIDPGEFNLVELIGSASEDESIYWDVAQRIADFLSWELVDVSV